MEGMRTRVRVVRVIEYEYTVLDEAVEDMAKWTNSLDLGHMRMRSTSLPVSKVYIETDA